jgi:hypothetical protein
MVPNTQVNNPGLLDSIVFGPVSASGGSTVVPTASESLFPSGSAAGACPRPMVRDSATGEAAQAGDPLFHEGSIAKPTLPATFNNITNQPFNTP